MYSYGSFLLSEWIGSDCLTYNYCFNITCLHGGKCQNGALRFTCKCGLKYTGLYLYNHFDFRKFTNNAHIMAFIMIRQHTFFVFKEKIKLKFLMT